MTRSDAKLVRVISSPQYFAMAFGATVGVAWVIILGDVVARAGPGGAVLAFALGGLAVLLVAFCYAELAGLRPAAGGEIVYAYELFGVPGAYAIGWATALLYIAACAFESISIGVVSDQLFPGSQGPVLYVSLGQDVHLGGVLLGGAFTLLFWVINSLGTSVATRLQEWTTYVRLFLMLGFLGVAAAFAKPQNLSPLFDHIAGQSAVLSFLGVLMTTPFWLGGFSVVACAMEESAPTSSMRAVGRAVVLAVAAAIVFYALLILSVSALTTHARLAAMKLPAAEAFQDALGSPLMVKVVLVVALLGNLHAWNSLLIAGARTLFALARAGLAAPILARVGTRSRTPNAAIAFVSLITLGALFLGQGFILPVVNITTVCFGLGYVVAVLAALRLRQVEADRARAWRVPGGRPTMWVALLCALAIVGLALIQPWLSSAGRMPPEWMVLVGWTFFGAVAWVAGGPVRRAISEDDRRRRLQGG